jgi:hypothetical protein
VFAQLFALGDTRGQTIVLRQAVLATMTLHWAIVVQLRQEDQPELLSSGTLAFQY